MKRRAFIFVVSFSLAMQQLLFAPSVLVCAAGSEKVACKEDDGIYEAEILYDKYMEEYANCIHGIKEWKKVNGKYQYPVTPYDKEWAKYPTIQEKYVACMIPQEIIDEISTEELFELVIDCPLLINIYAYSSYDEGVKEVAKQFNGIRELLRKKDCLEVVLNYYSNYNIPTTQQLDYDALLPENPSGEDYDVIVDDDTMMKKADQDIKVNEIIDVCEAIFEIASDENKIDNETLLRITQIILDKNEEKKKSEAVDTLSLEETKNDSLYNTWGKNEVLADLLKSTESSEVANIQNTYIFYTPSNYEVEYTINKSWKNISDDVVTGFLKRYKQYLFTDGSAAVTCVQNGTTKYDCFNFAWLYNYRYAENSLWKECDFINDEGFRKDDYYDKSNSPVVTPQVGSNGVHAVLVTKKKKQFRDSNNQVHEEPLVKSKWGTNGPLMKHPLSLCPFNTNNTLFYC